jgi:hypothetical protein
MKGSVIDKVVKHEPGLYFYLIFPIAFAFLLTFIGTRLISYTAPWLTIPWTDSYRVHHFVYGFFILAISGYLALVFSGPRAKYLIALLHGLGLGLAFDEFGFWLKLTDDDPARWSYDGFAIIIGVLFVILTARRSFRLFSKVLSMRWRHPDTLSVTEKELFKESEENFIELTRKDQF